MSNQIPIKMDWQQVSLNEGPPCFAVLGDQDTYYCGRAERWAGHGTHHDFISLERLLSETRVGAIDECVSEVNRLFSGMVALTIAELKAGIERLKLSNIISRGLTKVTANATVDGWMNILRQHTEGALKAKRTMLQRSISSNKETHDPPVVALSIGEHVDVAAFAVIGVCPIEVAATEVSETFKAALESSLKAEGR